MDIVFTFNKVTGNKIKQNFLKFIKATKHNRFWLLIIGGHQEKLPAVIPGPVCPIPERFCQNPGHFLKIYKI